MANGLAPNPACGVYRISYLPHTLGLGTIGCKDMSHAHGFRMFVSDRRLSSGLSPPKFPQCISTKGSVNIYRMALEVSMGGSSQNLPDILGPKCVPKARSVSCRSHTDETAVDQACASTALRRLPSFQNCASSVTTALKRLAAIWGPSQARGPYFRTELLVSCCERLNLGGFVGQGPPWKA